MDQTQIVKKKDYSLSEGVQVGDIFTIKGICDLIGATASGSAMTSLMILIPLNLSS